MEGLERQTALLTVDHAGTAGSTSNNGRSAKSGTLRPQESSSRSISPSKQEQEKQHPTGTQYTQVDDSGEGSDNDAACEHKTRFAHVHPVPANKVFERAGDAKNDADPRTVNLVIGAFRNEDGIPWVLPAIRSAEDNLRTKFVNEETNFEYLPIGGMPLIREGGPRLALGKDAASIKEGRAVGIQSLSGTGALRLAKNFLKNHLSGTQCTLAIPAQTWENHRTICNDVGLPFTPYRYYDSNTHALDFEGMTEDLEELPYGSAVLLHAVCHNPTGVDPTHEQWEQIAQICIRKNLTVLFDNAYQGLASGDIEADAFSMRLFDSKKSIPMLICSSFSKNFGLYAERCGVLTTVTESKSDTDAIVSHLHIYARAMWSNPPQHGALLVSEVLDQGPLENVWRDNVNSMAKRIRNARKMLHDALSIRETPGDWSHVLNQTGMFTYTGLSTDVITSLVEDHHVYLLDSGRISMCGVTEDNVEYLANTLFMLISDGQEKL